MTVLCNVEFNSPNYSDHHI